MDKKEERKQKMYEALAKAERLLEIKKLPAWEKDLQPMLSKNIILATGGEKDGKYYPGKVHKKDATQKEIEQSIGYASAMMDIYNPINTVESYIKDLRTKIASMEKE